MAEAAIQIEGMSCQHCVMRVKKALDALEGVTKTDVLVGNAAVSFDETKLKKEEIEAAIEKAGYKVIR
jgi:copper chaperone